MSLNNEKILGNCYGVKKKKKIGLKKWGNVCIFCCKCLVSFCLFFVNFLIFVVVSCVDFICWFVFLFCRLVVYNKKRECMNVSLKLNCEYNRFFEVFVKGWIVGECDLKFF